MGFGSLVLLLAQLDLFGCVSVGSVKIVFLLHQLVLLRLQGVSLSIEIFEDLSLLLRKVVVYSLVHA